MFRNQQASAALVVAVLALIAAVVGQATAGPGGPEAKFAASTQRIAKLALRQARKATRAARASRRVARDAWRTGLRARAIGLQAQGAADQAQAAADVANAAAGGAQATADQAKSSASEAQAAADQAMTMGRSAHQVGCDLPGAQECAGVSLTLPRSGRVLLLAAGSDASPFSVEGTCNFEIDDKPIVGPRVLSGELDVSGATSNSTDGFAITLVTDSLPAGPHKFSLACQAPSEWHVDNPMISALLIGPG